MLIPPHVLTPTMQHCYFYPIPGNPQILIFWALGIGKRVRLTHVYNIYLYYALGNADMILTCEYDGHILAYPVALAIRTANPRKYLMPPGAG